MGFVWGEEDGEVRFLPDEAVVSTMRTVFSKFTELGSVRKVWLWFRSEGLSFPLRSNMKSEIRWVAPTYTAIHHVLTNPVYAGAYAYGKSSHERYVDDRRSEDELVICRWPSGPYFFQNIIQDSSIGRRSKPTKHASTPTFILNHTKRVAR